MLFVNNIINVSINRFFFLCVMRKDLVFILSCMVYLGIKK